MKILHINKKLSQAVAALFSWCLISSTALSTDADSQLSTLPHHSRTKIENSFNSPLAHEMLDFINGKSEMHDFTSLDNLDPRASEVHSEDMVGYLTSIRRLIEKNGKLSHKCRAVYAGAGADISTLLLTTPCNDLYMIDLQSFDIDAFTRALNDPEYVSPRQFFSYQSSMFVKMLFPDFEIRSSDKRYVKEVVVPELKRFVDDMEHKYYAGKLGPELTPWSRKEILETYFNRKKERGSGISENELLSQMGVIFHEMEIKVIEELKNLGVKLDSIDNIDKQINSFTFRWNSDLEKKPRKYRVSFIKTDITNPKKYSKVLNYLLDKGIDVYLQKAGMNIPEKYSQFACKILSAINPGGFFISGDWSQSKGKTLQSAQELITDSSLSQLSKYHPFEGFCEGQATEVTSEQKELYELFLSAKQVLLKIPELITPYWYELSVYKKHQHELEL